MHFIINLQRDDVVLKNWLGKLRKQQWKIKAIETLEKFVEKTLEKDMSSYELFV